jgi:hypothetical protein
MCDANAALSGWRVNQKERHIDEKATNQAVEFTRS